MRTWTFILGAVLACYGTAGILSETVWQNSEKANHTLCRFLLCTNSLLMAQGQQLPEPSETDAQNAVAIIRASLERDAQNPYRWADLADAYFDAGQTHQARDCYRRLLDLAPQSPPLLLRVANFHFQLGETQEALPITARILRLTPDYDATIFSEYIRLVEAVDEVLQYGLPEDARAAKSWLRFLMQAGRLDDSQHTWQWAAARGLADDTLAGEYATFLFRQGHPDLAEAAWVQYLGTRSGEYRKSNFLFNGDFASEPLPSPFDWNLARAEGVEISRDCTPAPTGKCSLRIGFAGITNVAFAAASQLTFVEPGRYRFHALIRTEGLTTDQGIRFRVSDEEVPAHWDATFGNFTGTTPWSDVEDDLVVPPKTRLLQVQVIRQPSLKFDNKVGGTAWISDLRLEPRNISPPQ